MKTFAILITMARLSLAAGATDVQIEKKAFDWNRDGVPDTLVLYRDSLSEGPPTNFTRLRISLSGRGDFEFTEKACPSCWVNFAKELTWAPKDLLRKKSALKSEYAGLLKYRFRKRNEYFLCIFGFAPTDSPGSLTLLTLDSGGRPKILLQVESDLIDVQDSDGDGTSEIVLAPSHDEALFFGKHKYSNYSPFFVYSFQKDDSLALDEARSEKYNRRHYTGWAGFDTVGEYIIYHDSLQAKDVIITLDSAKSKYFGQARNE